jgi:hypothetical protein
MPSHLKGAEAMWARSMFQLFHIPVMPFLYHLPFGELSLKKGSRPVAHSMDSTK